MTLPLGLGMIELRENLLFMIASGMPEFT